MTEPEYPHLFVGKQDAPRIREAFGDDVFDGNFVVSKDVPSGIAYVIRTDLHPLLDLDTSGTVDPKVIKRLMERIAREPRLEVEKYPEMHPDDVEYTSGPEWEQFVDDVVGDFAFPWKKPYPAVPWRSLCSEDVDG